MWVKRKTKPPNYNAFQKYTIWRHVLYSTRSVNIVTNTDFFRVVDPDAVGQTSCRGQYYSESEEYTNWRETDVADAELLLMFLFYETLNKEQRSSEIPEQNQPFYQVV